MCRRGVGDAEPPQRLDGNRRRAIHLSRPIVEVPARHGQHAVVGEVAEEARPRLDRIERVLPEDEGPGSGRRPGVDERNLDGAVALGRPRDEAARLVVDEPHARIPVEVAGEIAEPSIDDPDDVPVDLDRGHRPGAEGERREHVAPAARTDDQRIVFAPEIVGDVGDVVLQVFEGAEVAVEVGHDGAGPHVDVELELPQSRRRHAWTEPPSLRRQQQARIAHHAHARVRVPPLVERTRFDDALRCTRCGTPGVPRQTITVCAAAASPNTTTHAPAASRKRRDPPS